MRIRILAPLLVLLVAVVGVLVVPLLGNLSEQRTAELGLDRRLAMEQITALARTAFEDGDSTALHRHVSRYHDLFGEDVLVVSAAGEPGLKFSAGALHEDDPKVRRLLRAYGFNLPSLTIPTVLPWSEGSALISAPIVLDRDLSGGAVVMEVDTSTTRAAVRRDWLLVLGLTVIALLLLTALTLWSTRWILGPVHRLDEATNALASGAPVTELQDTGPPELRRLARSFGIMQEALSSTLDQQRELLGDTSHQLRNRLAAIRLHVDLLGASYDSADDAALQPLQQDLDRLDHTVDRLLVLAEVEHQAWSVTAQRHLDRSPARATPVAAVLAHVRDRWMSLRPGNPAGPRVDVSVESGLRLAVREQDVLEIVDNLVDNAVKYAGPGSSVCVSVSRSPDGSGSEVAQLVVDDDGSGLSDKELRHVGTRFWRSSRHSALPGTGLGLAIVTALARANDGTVTLSRSTRGGVRVIVELPAVDP